MKTTIALRIGHKPVAFFVILTAVSHIFVSTLGKVVLIDKIVAGVVGRININHLDLAKIGFLQEFQHFQIIALDIKVLAVKATGRAIFANTVRHNRTQCCRDGRIGRQHGFFLVRPGKLIAFLSAFHDGIRKFLPQNVKINGVFHLAVTHHFGDGIGEQLADQLYISLHAVKAVHFQFVHLIVPPFPVLAPSV